LPLADLPALCPAVWRRNLSPAFRP